MLGENFVRELVERVEKRGRLVRRRKDDLDVPVLLDLDDDGALPLRPPRDRREAKELRLPVVRREDDVLVRQADELRRLARVAPLEADVAEAVGRVDEVEDAAGERRAATVPSAAGARSARRT